MTDLKIISVLKDIEQKSTTNSPSHFSRFLPPMYGPESIEQLHKLEKFVGHPLPTEHMAVLQTFGGSSIYGKKAGLTFFSVNELINSVDRVEQWDASMTNTSLIGSDDGGYLYFYDLINQTSKGIHSIFLCYPGNMSWEDSQFIGTSLLEVVTEIIDGNNFEDKPYLGQLNMP
jgi:hypothetical protein